MYIYTFLSFPIFLESSQSQPASWLGRVLTISWFHDLRWHGKAHSSGPWKTWPLITGDGGNWKCNWPVRFWNGTLICWPVDVLGGYRCFENPVFDSLGRVTKGSKKSNSWSDRWFPWISHETEHGRSSKAIWHGQCPATAKNSLICSTIQFLKSRSVDVQWFQCVPTLCTNVGQFGYVFIQGDFPPIISFTLVVPGQLILSEHPNRCGDLTRWKGALHTEERSWIDHSTGSNLFPLGCKLCACVYMITYIYIYVYIYMYIYICIYIYMYVCMYIYIYVIL